MICIAILDNLGVEVGWEKLERPAWVYRNPRNGRVLRCDRNQAQGVVSADGSCYYALSDDLPGAKARAKEITLAEYLEHESQAEAPDVEDVAPEVPEGVEESAILSRAQLTEKVAELEEAVELLLSGVTE